MGASNGNGHSAGQRPKRNNGRRLNVRDRGDVAALDAYGLSVRQIARVLRASANTVTRVLKSPDVIATRDLYRDAIRQVAMANITLLQQEAYDRARGALRAKDAKSWDAYTRGIKALEGVAASASGENKPVSVTAVQVNTVQPSKEEFLELARALGLVVDGQAQLPQPSKDRPT